MLKLNPDPQFTNDVELTVPGQQETGTVALTFKYFGKTALEEFWESVKGKSDVEIIGALVTGWGLPEEYAEENLGIFLDNYPLAAAEILKHYQSALLESRIKN